MEEIARRAGVTGMIAGQSMDVKLEGATPDAAMVGYIHRHKTADLITAPIVAGLLLAGADGAQLKAGTAYGQALGLAFQIVDDLLDVLGDAQTMGKTVGKDAQQGKMTWPTVFGIEDSRIAAGNLIDEAVNALSCFGKNASFLTELARESLSRIT